MAAPPYYAVLVPPMRSAPVVSACPSCTVEFNESDPESRRVYCAKCSYVVCSSCAAYINCPQCGTVFPKASRAPPAANPNPAPAPVALAAPSVVSASGYDAAGRDRLVPASGAASRLSEQPTNPRIPAFTSLDLVNPALLSSRAMQIIAPEDPGDAYGSGSSVRAPPASSSLSRGVSSSGTGAPVLSTSTIAAPLRASDAAFMHGTGYEPYSGSTGPSSSGLSRGPSNPPSSSTTYGAVQPSDVRYGAAIGSGSRVSSVSSSETRYGLDPTDAYSGADLRSSATNPRNVPVGSAAGSSLSGSARSMYGGTHSTSGDPSVSSAAGLANIATRSLPARYGATGPTNDHDIDDLPDLESLSVAGAAAGARKPAVVAPVIPEPALDGPPARRYGQIDFASFSRSKPSEPTVSNVSAGGLSPVLSPEPAPAPAPAPKAQWDSDGSGHRDFEARMAQMRADEEMARKLQKEMEEAEAAASSRPQSSSTRSNLATSVSQSAQGNPSTKPPASTDTTARAAGRGTAVTVGASKSPKPADMYELTRSAPARTHTRVVEDDIPTPSIAVSSQERKAPSMKSGGVPQSIASAAPKAAPTLVLSPIAEVPDVRSPPSEPAPAPAPAPVPVPAPAPAAPNPQLEQAVAVYREHETRYKQLREDEEMARKLQEELVTAAATAAAEKEAAEKAAAEKAAAEEAVSGEGFQMPGRKRKTHQLADMASLTQSAPARVSRKEARVLPPEAEASVARTRSRSRGTKMADTVAAPAFVPAPAPVPVPASSAAAANVTVPSPPRSEPVTPAPAAGAPLMPANGNKAVVKVFWDIENAPLARNDSPDDNSIPTARMLDNLKARLSDHGYWKPSFRMDVTAYHNPRLENEFVVSVPRANELNRNDVILLDVGTKRGVADHKLKRDVDNCLEDIFHHGLRVACMVIISGDSDFTDSYQKILRSVPAVPLLVVHRRKVYREVREIAKINPEYCFTCEWEKLIDELPRSKPALSGPRYTFG